MDNCLPFCFVQPGEDSDKAVRTAWSFCQKKSKSIEVRYKNMKGDEILTKVHFHIDPEVTIASRTIDLSARVNK